MTAATKRRPAATTPAPAPEPTMTSAAMRTELDSLRSALAAECERHGVLTARRGPAMLAGDPGALDDLEQQITLSERDIGRYEAAIAELEQRLAEAEAREASAAGEAAYRRRVELDAEGTALLGDIETLGGQIAAKLTRLDGCQRESQQIDPSIAEAGLHERLAEELGWRIRGPAWSAAYGIITKPGVVEIPSTVSDRPLWGTRRGHDRTAAPYVPGVDPSVVVRPAGVYDAEGNRIDAPLGYGGPPAPASATQAFIARSDRAHGWT